MGKDNLKIIATELVTQVRKSVTIDRTLRESARAKIRVLVKRILRRHGYHPTCKTKGLNLCFSRLSFYLAFAFLVQGSAVSDGRQSKVSQGDGHGEGQSVRRKSNCRKS